MFALRVGHNASRIVLGSSSYRVNVDASTLSRAVSFLWSHNTNGQTNSSINACCQSRSFADKPVSRPKAHTGRTPAKTRKKKAVVVTDAATQTEKPARKPRAKKAAVSTDPPATKATRAAEAKIGAPAKSGRPAKAASGSTTKSKAKPKPKVKKTRAKKVLTEEQQTAKVATELKKKQYADLKELKATALKKPALLPSSAWKVFQTELAKSNAGKEGTSVVVSASKEASAKYKSFTPEETEHYNHIANQNTIKNREVLRTWVESFTPIQIREANNVRNQLKRRGVKGYNLHIKDDRLVKRPGSAMTLYVKDRFLTGDYKHIKASEAFKLIVAEWKEASVGDKQQYLDKRSEKLEEYKKQYKATYNEESNAASVSSASP